MKFGLIYNTGYYGTDPDQLIAAARQAEACGFESFYVTAKASLTRPRRLRLRRCSWSLRLRPGPAGAVG
jgi:hypothetical protein